MNKNAYDFISKEYEALRREMDEAVKETRVLERYALLATGAIWSWLIGTSGYELAKWLPAFIVGFLGFRALALTSHIDFLGKYFAKVEKAFPLPSGLGFEQQFEGSSVAERKRRTAYWFWGVLLFFTVVIPYISKIA